MSRDKRMADEELLREFCAGRRAALAELARRHEAALLGLAAGFLGGRRDLACDAVQETWLRVIRFGGSFNGRSSVKTWLYRVVLSRCRDLADERKAGSEVATRAMGESTAAEPGGQAALQERDGALRSAVGQLSPEQQAVVLLCYHESLTHEQAAEILEIPLGTLKSRLHAALAALRTALRGLDET